MCEQLNISAPSIAKLIITIVVVVISTITLFIPWPTPHSIYDSDIADIDDEFIEEIEEIDAEFGDDDGSSQQIISTTPLQVLRN